MRLVLSALAASVLLFGGRVLLSARGYSENASNFVTGGGIIIVLIGYYSHRMAKEKSWRISNHELLGPPILGVILLMGIGLASLWGLWHIEVPSRGVPMYLSFIIIPPVFVGIYRRLFCRSEGTS